MNRVISIDKIIGGVKIINIIPVEILGDMWLCVGFEPEDEYMGDYMHLMLIFSSGLKPADNLVKQMISIFENTPSGHPLVRIHSECILGDALKSDLCDCGEQLDAALDSISNSGQGILLYLRQEGRGIGMRAKLAALAAQDGYVAGVKRVNSMSPDSANLFCGFKIDERDYAVAYDILQVLKIKQINMITGSMKKIEALRSRGISVHTISDMRRNDLPKGTRKYKEFYEKSKRDYLYNELGMPR